MEAALNVAYGGLNTGGKIEMSAGTKKIINESTIQGYISGGRRSDALRFLSGDKVAGIGEFIRAGIDLDSTKKENKVDPPQAISYTVSYLNDNTLARVSSTTDYTITTENLTNTPQQLVSATVHFDSGDDGKDKSTNLRVYLFDNSNLGINNPSTVDTIGGPNASAAYTDFFDNNEQGVGFVDNSSLDYPLKLYKPATDQSLKNGILFLWLFPHGHDRWQVTPSLHLIFKKGSPKDVRLNGLDFHNGGFSSQQFSLN